MEVDENGIVDKMGIDKVRINQILGLFPLPLL